jgi:carbon-monoxide dehydrogenase large subunit
MCSMKIVSNPCHFWRPTRAKGAGEAGCVGALPVVMIAIMNALADCGGS